MPAPGAGPAGTVGWVYVQAITDTSGMKDDIERAGGEAGVAGHKAYRDGWESEEKKKPINDVLFGKAVQSRMKRVAKDFGKQLAQAQVDGVEGFGSGKGVTLNLESQVESELEGIALAFGKTKEQVQKEWDKGWTGVFSGEFDKAQRKIEKNMGGLGKTLVQSIGEGFNSEAARLDLKDLTDRIAKAVMDGTLTSTEDLDRLFGDEVRQLKVELDLEDDDIAGQIRRQIPAAIAQFEKLEQEQERLNEKMWAAATLENKKYNQQAIAEARQRSATILKLSNDMLAAENRSQGIVDREQTKKGLAILQENARLMDKWADQIDIVDARYRNLFGTTDDGFHKLNLGLDSTLVKTKLIIDPLRKFKKYAIKELIRPEALLSVKDADKALSGLRSRLSARSQAGFFPDDRSLGLSFAQARRNVIENVAADAKRLQGVLRSVTPSVRQFFRTVFVESTKLQGLRVKDGVWSTGVWESATFQMRNFFATAFRESRAFRVDEGAGESARWSPKWWQEAQFGMQRFFKAAFEESRAFGKVRPIVDTLSFSNARDQIDKARVGLKRSVTKFYDTYVDKREVARTVAQAKRAAELISSPFRRFFGPRGGADLGGLAKSISGKGIQIPITVNKDAFQKSIINAAENIEKRLTPAVKDALRNGQKVDWDFSKSARKEIDKVANHFEISFGDAAKTVEHVLGDSIRRGMRAVDDERNLATFERFGHRVNRLTVGLFRAGGAGPLGIVTSLLGSIVGTFTTVFNLILSVPKALGKVGEAFQVFGETIIKVFGPIGKVVGGAIKGFGSALIKFAKNPLVLAATAVVALTSGLGFMRTMFFGVVGLVRALGGVLVMLGGALYYAAGAAVILGPAIVALGAGAAALFLGASDAFNAMQLLNTAVSSDKKEDWDKYNEALGKLGPNAASAVRELKPLFVGLKNVRKELSEKIFAGIGDQIKKTLPGLKPVKEAFIGLGDALNASFKSILGLFSQQTFIADIVTLLKNAQPIIVNFATAIANVIGGIASLFATISPLAVSFSEALVRGSESFRTSVESNKEPILNFFTRAYEIASQVWNIIFELGKILASLFGATYDANTGPQGLLTAINNKLTGIKTWIDANPDVIKKWFDDSREVLGQVGGLISTIFEGLKNMDSEEIQTAITNVMGWIEGLAKAVNAVATAIDAITTTAKEWEQNPLSPGGGGFGGPVDFTKVPQSAESRRAIANAVPLVGRRTRRAAGGLVHRPEIALIGEAGPELVIPLRRPLHLIDPQAREAARMLRGKERERHSTGPQKVVNLTQNITPMQSDPAAVAASVVNRAVAIARG